MSKRAQDPGRGVGQRNCSGALGIHEHVNMLLNLENEWGCVCIFTSELQYSSTGKEKMYLAICTYVLGTSLSMLVFSVHPGGAMFGDC